MKNEFIKLEDTYVEWFDKNDSLIDDYFIDGDILNEFVPNCDLPEKIKDDCNKIKVRLGFRT